MTTSLTTDEARPEVRVSATGVLPRNIDEVYRLAQALSKARPHKGLDTPEMVMLAILKGLDVGFTPTQAMQECHVINGKVGFSGKAILALIRRSKIVDPAHGFRIECERKDDAKDLVAIVTSKRIDEPHANVTEFSMTDAKRANLGGSDTWKKYPDRMLRWRAVQIHGDLYYSDVTVGNHAAEVLEDYPADAPTLESVVKDVTPKPIRAEDDPALIELGIVSQPGGPAATDGAEQTTGTVGGTAPSDLEVPFELEGESDV